MEFVRDAAPVRRRYRFLFRRLAFADISVAAKLVLVLLLPLSALLGLAGVTASVYAGRSGDVRGAVASAVSASAEAGRVVDGLQRERLALARSTPAGDGGDPARTDAAVARFRAASAGVPGAAVALDGLAALRARAQEPPGQGVLLGYRQLIADLIAFQQAVADRPAPPAVLAGSRAAGWLAVGKEELALVQVTAVRVLATGELTPADRDAIAAHRAAAASAFDRFTAAATPAWRAVFEGLDVTADVEPLLLSPPSAPADTAGLTRASLAQLDGLQALADRVAADTAGTVGDARDRQNRALVLGLAAVLAVVVAAVALAVAAARSLRRRLRALLTLALRLAPPAVPSPGALPGVDLRAAGPPGGPFADGAGADPSAGATGPDPRVAGAPAGARAGGAAPAPRAAGSDPRADQVSAAEPRAAGLSGVEPHAAGVAAGEVAAGRDEIGRVAEALDAVRRATAQATAQATARAAADAAGQAELRAREAGMYTDLGHRAARLADALLERLDEAERDEADPDRLALLFAFDHLATRIRHDANSLLVLAGADAGRAHPAPVPLLDVLRAAQSQIHAYERVEYGRVDDDTAVEPAAVDGVVHLLAELLDNAARHSGGEHAVVVEARRAGDGAVVHVTDHGRAAADPVLLAELNARLADPPAAGPRLGLTVVARIAARHGIDVALQPAPAGGLVATVRLPQGMVVHQPRTPPVLPEPAARRLPPRPLERSPALPGAEPMDIPLPRKGGLPVPVVPSGVVAEGPTVEARAFDDGLPRRTVNASPQSGTTGEPGTTGTGTTGTTDVSEPGDGGALLPANRHPIGRFGTVLTVRQEGHATS
ncbi:nitrate- and nitrite sensing domain-containing protein [Dactylosporangium sp. NPDC000521]|uniref:sensor histidine kinase n=1 Tax=Dactylosporangium sp. NPDC000521 TaxID=3363975 RepID=UPI003686DD40